MNLNLKCFSCKNIREGYPLEKENRPIGMFKVGTVVQDTKPKVGIFLPLDRFGHIVGFSRSDNKDLLLVVKWEDRFDPQRVHPSDIIFHSS